MFPTALCMAFELATYGGFAGLLYRLLPRKKISIYIALISAMILGRVVWGGAMYACMGMQGNAFTLSAFLAGALTNAIPGIIAQIILVPILVMLLTRESRNKVST